MNVKEHNLKQLQKRRERLKKTAEKPPEPVTPAEPVKEQTDE